MEILQVDDVIQLQDTQDEPKQITVSENVFRDLLSCKSKVEDIKVVLQKGENVSKTRFMRKVGAIIYSHRYSER